jgi:hypothetical protein
MRPAVSERGPRRAIAACAHRGPSLNPFAGAGRGRLTTGNHTALEGSYSNSASPSSRRHRKLCVSKCTRGSSSNAAACSSAGAPGAARGNEVGTVADIKTPNKMCVSRSRKGRAWACLARLGATTLPPPLAVVVLRAPKYCSDPYGCPIVSRAAVPTHSSFNDLQAGENPRGSASSNSYHTDVDDVGTREGRNVRGTTRVMDWHWHWHCRPVLAPHHRLFYTGFPRSTGCACQLCLSITSF